MGRQGRTAAAWTLRSILEAAGQRTRLRRLATAGTTALASTRPPPPPSNPPTSPKCSPPWKNAAAPVLSSRSRPKPLQTACSKPSPSQVSSSPRWALLNTDLATREQHRRDHARIARLVRPGGPVVVAVDDPEASLLSAANLHADSPHLLKPSQRSRPAAGKPTTKAPKARPCTSRHRLRRQLRQPRSAGWARPTTPALPPPSPWPRPASSTATPSSPGSNTPDAIPGSLELLSFAQGIPIWTRPGHLARTNWPPRSIACELDVTGRLFCILCTPHQNRLAPGPPPRRSLRAPGRSGHPHPRYRHPPPTNNLRALRAWFHQAGRVRVEDDREQAIAAALQIARPGDGMLIVGPARSWLRATGTDRTRSIPIDDRQIIRRHLPDQATRRSA